MYRLLIFWRYNCDRAWLCRQVLQVTLASLCLTWVGGPWVGALTGIIGIIVWNRSYLRQLISFVLATRRFNKLATDRMIMMYSPSVMSYIDPGQCFSSCLEEFDIAQSRFDVDLRRRPVVYLFRSVTEIHRLFITSPNAFALVGGDAIVVPVENDSCDLRGVVRHELVHIFAWYWNSNCLPLLAEGLASWLQGPVWGKPCDYYASRAIFQDDRFELVDVMSRGSVSKQSANDAFVVASFIHYLVERHGWNYFRRLYIDGKISNFEKSFFATYGFDLLVAENQWREWLINWIGASEFS